MAPTNGCGKKQILTWPAELSCYFVLVRRLNLWYMVTLTYLGYGNDCILAVLFYKIWRQPRKETVFWKVANGFLWKFVL